MIFYSHANETHFYKKSFALFRNLEKALMVYCSDCIVYGSLLLIVTLRWHGILFLVDSRGFVLENIADLTTKERDSMKEKYCIAKYFICV